MNVREILTPFIENGETGKLLAMLNVSDPNAADAVGEILAKGGVYAGADENAVAYYVVSCQGEELLDIEEELRKKLAGVSAYLRPMPAVASKHEDEYQHLIREDFFEDVEFQKYRITIQERRHTSEMRFHYTADEILSIIRQMSFAGVSDWQIIPGKEIKIRNKGGKMVSINEGKIVTEEEVIEVLREMAYGTNHVEAIEGLYKRNRENKLVPDFTKRLPPQGVNFAYSVQGENNQTVVRLRVNVHLIAPIGHERRWRGLAMSIRRIPTAPPSPTELNFHRAGMLVVNDVVEREIDRGLILVVGPTGAGKTHTVAAIIEQVNLRQPLNIITVEDPVEIVYLDKEATIQQIELGSCVASYEEAGRNAKRQDPDIIAIGEIRDAATASVAVELALTGHLVLATMHAATTTYDAIIKLSQFVGDAKIVAQALQAIIAQRLLSPSAWKGGKSRERRVLLMEVVRFNERNELRDFVLARLPNRDEYYQRVAAAKDESCILLEDCIVEKILEGDVSPVEGFVLAENKQRYMSGVERVLQRLPEHLANPALSEEERALQLRIQDSLKRFQERYGA